MNQLVPVIFLLLVIYFALKWIVNWFNENLFLILLSGGIIIAIIIIGIVATVVYVKYDMDERSTDGDISNTAGTKYPNSNLLNNPLASPNQNNQLHQANILYNKKDDSLTTKITELLLKNNYLSPLVRKRNYLITTDDYGDINKEKWNKELISFSKKKILPKIESNRVDCLSHNWKDELVKEIVVLLDHITWQYQSDFDYNFSNDMDGIEYEHFCSKILEKNNWEVRILQASGDQGVDIIASKDGHSVAIQCKRFSSKVGNSAVQEVTAGKNHYHADAAAVVSNNDFTGSAKELAKSNNVLLLHHSDLEDLNFESS